MPHLQQTLGGDAEGGEHLLSPPPLALPPPPPPPPSPPPPLEAAASAATPSASADGDVRLLFHSSQKLFSLASEKKAPNPIIISAFDCRSIWSGA